MRIRVPRNSSALLAGVLVALLLPSAMAEGASRQDGDDALGPLDIAKVKVDQSGRNSRVLIKTRGPWRLSQLDPQPSISDEAPPDYLCFDLWQGPHSRTCFGTSPGGKPIAVRAKVSKKGRTFGHSRLAAQRIERPNRRSVELVIRFRRLGLEPGRFRWRVLSGWDDPTCFKGGLPRVRDCRDRTPDAGSASSRIRKPKIVGCTRDENRVNYHGSRNRKRIALTFDDGPSSYTGKVLRILNRYDAKGTFFTLGSQIRGRESLLRRMVRARHEIGNHSMSHSLLPPCSDLRSASHCIERASGFEPCTFRPPYGAVSGTLADSAWRLGMSSIVWDIDTNDWRMPGSGAIAASALAARSGSIVLMHDGGGYRGQTVAALPQIVRTLTGRGYRLVTVSKLLGERFRWRP